MYTASQDELRNLNAEIEEQLMADGGQTSVNWKHGRQLLRQYLQEIGYTDTIIDVRSNRVRSLLGLNSAANQDNDSSAGQSSSNNSINSTQFN